ncbi:MAG: hypothetical protein B7Z81_10250 [Acidocella sp. 20-61-6]|nr:MAG: hypothetical protein B7Z81_10250 [Acidocella sp. 20-61-6]
MQSERQPQNVIMINVPSLIRTTGFRLAALGAAFASLGAGVIFVVIYFGTVGAMIGAIDQQINDETAEIVDPGEKPRTPDLVKSAHEAQDESVHGTFITLIDPNGKIVATNLANPSRIVGWGWHYSTIISLSKSRPKVTRSLGIKLADGGLLVIGEDATELMQLKERLARTFLVSFIIMLVFGLGAGVAFGRSAVFRVQQINSTLERIMGGDFNQRLARSGRGDEIDNLAFSVNLMLDRIEFLMENLRQVGNEIAHDLRSPLARLREGLAVC